MEAYDEFLRWARDKGIEIHGIEPRPIPGKGIGMVATKPLEPNERVLYVPASALRTLDTVRPKVKKMLPRGTKVHAILAADLALERPNSKYGPWNAVIPSRDALFTSLPLAWDDERLHSYLPKPALALLHKQQSKFTRDWTAVQQAAAKSSSSSSSSSSTAAVPTRPDFLYAWLLVNTRSFYHESARTARLPRDDRMVLQPVADLFNHHTAAAADDDDDGGCEVAFGPPGGGFSVTVADGRRRRAPYAAGDEVCICYGRHPSDFLLVEYGFVPARNRWDEVGLDDAVLPELGEAHRARLEEKGFLGGCVLDARTVCYRTQVALRLLLCSSEEWERFVDEGEDGGEALQRRVDGLLVTILRKYLRGTVERTIQELGSVEVGQPSQREVLSLRWQQIRSLIDQTIERLES